MGELWERVESLPLAIEGYELSGHDREYGAFTRGSTLVHLRGGGEEGLGEDVVYDVLDHIAHRDAGPVHDFTGVRTLGELCALEEPSRFLSACANRPLERAQDRERE